VVGNIGVKENDDPVTQGTYIWNPTLLSPNLGKGSGKYLGSPNQNRILQHSSSNRIGRLVLEKKKKKKNSQEVLRSCFVLGSILVSSHVPRRDRPLKKI